MNTTTPSNPSRFHYGWIVLATSAFVVLGSLGLARFGYSVILPSMQAGLELDNTQAGLIATISLLGYLTLSVLGGALAARYGARAVVTVGLAAAGLGMLLTGGASNLIMAALGQGIAGMGSGGSNVPVMGLVSGWAGRGRRGLASGVAVSGAGVGVIVSGRFIPQVLDAYGADGWRMSWYLLGGVTVFLALLSGLLLRNNPGDMGLAPLGGFDSGEKPQAEKTKVIIWGQIYRSKIVWHLGLVYIAFGFAYIIYLTFFTKYLIAEGGYDRQGAGSLFMLMGWFSLLCGLLWGMVSDAIGRKRALIIVYLIHAASFTLFSLWASPAGFTVSAILFGLSAWSIPAIMAATCGDILGPRLAPAALGFITLFFGVGQALGPSIAGMVADATGSFSQAFLLAGSVSLLGALGAGFLRPASSE